MPPVTQKLLAAIAGALLLLGGLGYLIYDQMDQNAMIQTEIDGIDAEIQGLDAIIATRDSKKALRDAQDQVFRQLVEILPQYSERQEERIYEAVTQYGSVAKLQFRGVVVGLRPPSGPAPAGGPQPAGQAAPKDFAQTELTCRFEGTYYNFLKFLNLVENHESFLRIDEVLLSPTGAQPVDANPDQKELQIRVKISTFAYVSK